MMTAFTTLPSTIFSRRGLWIAILTAFLFLGVVPSARGQESPTFAPTQVVNDYPDRIAFSTRVASPGPMLVEAEFRYAIDAYLGLENVTRVKLEMESAREVSLTYTWDTSDITIPPWTPMLVSWRTMDEDGVWHESEPQRVVYEDIRFQWQRLETDDLVVLWHDKPATFGNAVFEIAQEAIRRQRRLFGVDLTIPIHLVVYNSREEFQAWHSLGLDWIGGEAFPDIGVTTQIVTSQTPDDYWLKAVVPHEISHLYLHQAAYNPRAPVPVWLNEGVAQFNEFITREDAEALVQEAVREGKLIPLTSLEDGFGKHDEERVALGYAEGWSAVTYLVETYGEEGLARLLAAYKAGLPTKKAFPEALGVDMGTFQADWAEWLGAPRSSMNTPTPWPIATYPPPPNYSGATPSPTPTSSGQVTASPPATATSSSTATPAATPRPVNANPPPPFTLPCLGALWLLPIPLFIAWRRR